MKIGSGRTTITPPLPVQLAGHRGRRIAIGVGDNLHARALVLEEGERRVAIISADLLWLDRGQCETVREHVSAATGIPRSNTLVACTHTHSGPDTLDWYETSPPVDRAWLATLLRQVATSAYLACQSMNDVDLYWAQGEIATGVNRRFQVGGIVERVPTFSGPVDRKLTVVWFVTQPGRIAGAILHHGTHPVVLGPESLLVSGDWCGIACHSLERRLRASCLYLNGNSGDVNPAIGVGMPYSSAVQLGQQVANAALRLMRDAGKKACGPLSLAINSRVLVVSAHPHPYLIAAQKRRVESDCRMRVEVQCLRIGPLTVLGMPGEVLVKTGENLLEAASTGPLLIVGGANDYVGYLPLPEQIAEGGYEGRARMLSEEGILTCVKAAKDLAMEISIG